MGGTSRNGEWQCKTGYFTLTLNRDLPGVLSLVIFFYKLQIFDVTKYKVLKYFNLFLMSLMCLSFIAMDPYVLIIVFFLS